MESVSESVYEGISADDADCSELVDLFHISHFFPQILCVLMLGRHSLAGDG